MAKALVIVESPAKIKTLKKFLGSGYIFESSVGHIRDLPQKEFGIDLEHDFEPKYVTLPEKKDVIKKLQDAAKKVDLVYLCPDPDREGEAIAWHIAAILPKGTKYKRASFQSITKAAVQAALDKPRNIDMDLVNAQQARRLLDRMVGYKISPILTRKVKRGRSGTSAGRVQSVALKLVVDREKEIEAFIPIEYWTLEAQLETSSKEKSFTAYVFSVDGLKVEKEATDKPHLLISNGKTAQQITDRLKKANYKVGSVEKKEKKRHPPPPFITSTLQQEASRHYSYGVSRTMSIAQELYEGVDLGHEGAEGLITYMRTDSVNIVPEAIAAAREFIGKEYGADYLPDQPRHFASKKSAQEAHEAIRPTSLARPPEKVRSHLTPDQFKLYLLIWRRFVASQMNPAVYDTVSADIETNQEIVLRATGSTMKFSGYLAAYEEKRDVGHTEEEDGSKALPPLEEGKALKLLDLIQTQSFTKPPPRFTEPSLVKELERLGIGRPSTYAAIMNKIQSRDYTIKENQALKPTELGRIIAQMLEDNFKLIMDVSFTANMEDKLEQVAEHENNWKALIRDFWKQFLPLVEHAEKEALVPRIDTQLPCPKCGKHLQKIWAREKYFYGCSNYPTCEYTAPLEALTFNKADFEPGFDYDRSCPKCEGPMSIRHGRFGPFLGCNKYPECKGIVNIPRRGEGDATPCPAKGCDGQITAKHSRFGKIFYSCSNYPDCDVIGNSREDLAVKYVDHPKTAYVKRPKAEKGKRGAGSGYNRPLKLSEELAAVTGLKKDASRPEVTKAIWVYIKKHKLQDPKNKRLIRPDKALAKVIGKEPVDMMQLARVLAPHLKSS